MIHLSSELEVNGERNIPNIVAYGAFKRCEELKLEITISRHLDGQQLVPSTDVQ